MNLDCFDFPAALQGKTILPGMPPSPCDLVHRCAFVLQDGSWQFQDYFICSIYPDVVFYHVYTLPDPYKFTCALNGLRGKNYALSFRVNTEVGFD